MSSTPLIRGLHRLRRPDQIELENPVLPPAAAKHSSTGLLRLSAGPQFQTTSGEMDQNQRLRLDDVALPTTNDL